MAAAVGPYGGTAAARGFEGAGGAAGGRAVGPAAALPAGSRGRTAARLRGVAPAWRRGGRIRPRLALRSLHRRGGRADQLQPLGRLRPGWYAAHPGAWYAAGWAAGAAWRAATWDSSERLDAYYPDEPVYYDYGNNVTYQDNSVYVNGQSVGTADQYYNQAANLAATGAEAEAPADGDWLPLGVFALTKPDQAKSDVTIQLAVNKQGIIRGNYTDTVTDKTQSVQGSVDKKTQRVAFTVGDNTTNVIETGLYNLTKDEAPCLIHFGKDRTEQWLLVRLQPPAQGK